MNKLANMRHWSERMSPANFGMSSRPNVPMPAIPPHQKVASQGAPPQTPPHVLDSPIHYSFNVPFSSDLAGPNTEDILHATADAVLRWTHPEDAPDDVPVFELPVHAQNLASLRKLCKDISASPLDIEAHVISTSPKNIKGQVTTVCLSGAPELVYRTRETILNDTPLSLRCTTVDIDGDMILDPQTGGLKKPVTETLDFTSNFCGVDIFLLGPKLTPLADGLNGESEVRRDQRWRLAIYGDYLSSEHAKTRVLIHIDQLLGRIVDGQHLELTTHQPLCGRNRKNLKLIESSTRTAIYMPPSFSNVFRYCPPNAKARDPSQILITGEDPTHIELAKKKIHDLLSRLRLFVKDVEIPPEKIDTILLSRMDKVQKISEAFGTHIAFPPLGSRQTMVRIQGLENLHIERTARELMALVGQFYSGFWSITQPDGRQHPSNHDVRTMLGDICANSDADVSFQRLSFRITGSDDAVKAALMVLSQIKFAAQSQYQIKVKIELANEHKEFVSGKKNGKINKIMGQSSVQIMFEGFGEYNFNIDVNAQSYESMKQGLSLVEQEMPASISFHVPDQYHKRIIGIGGQHIQRIMKKHSVFVKFSNAMDRGGMREDDDIRVDNVICRTPARNAQNLELVKSEILEMVDRVDSEFTSQIVNVDRLYHRQLLTRLNEIEGLEKKWNCKIVFPSTEQASDEVTVTGPQWQVPQCVDEFLGMVSDNHELVLAQTPSLMKYLESLDFSADLVGKLKSQHEVEVTVHTNKDELTEDGEPTVTLLWTFTRNNAGGLRDAIEFLQNQFVTSGVEAAVIKGAIPRPKSDTFEESLPFFDSKLLQHAPTPVATDSPTKVAFGDEAARERSTIFDRLRKPGSMSSISSFLDRRKNSSHSGVNSFFKGSSNVSKSSLISIESTRSFNADRNPWNDSGVNLADEDQPWSARAFGNGMDHKLMVPQPGDMTPRHNTRHSGDSGRPSTSHSTHSGYPGPIGPFR
ncbi:KH domain-containing protein, variant [Gaeumannomyces tritici R3-111a-1]|uniref:KH domain-containing protein n=1 Tax=Gaeumannomyces tritici (strain R3-111a-1) TaxID=644352 RepID=J3NNS3_GAET3|nr:KH domain-containing protein [Gaeumannomyces tritici R3-111a-1]XP_009218972.1 KH domain-containing protein, variant [Gaeumannomyces tritici R3-111a-1]EJT77826.1 KH domain-containing protein, variant [Gaeumannomyces tritici R3-111a-1]EJT77827.1 KH domain-containing protein [Gaeumannomyces tritici R3-111a-1]